MLSCSGIAVSCSVGWIGTGVDVEMAEIMISDSRAGSIRGHGRS